MWNSSEVKQDFTSSNQANKFDWIICFKGLFRMNKLKNILNVMGFIGAGIGLNAVLFSCCDLVTIKEAITVLILGGSTTAIASLINNFIK